MPSRKSSAPAPALSIEDLHGELVRTLLEPLAASLAEIQAQLERLERQAKEMANVQKEVVSSDSVSDKSCPRKDSWKPSSSLLQLPLPNVSALTALPSKSANAALAAGSFMKDKTNAGFACLFKNNASTCAEEPLRVGSYTLLPVSEADTVHSFGNLSEWSSMSSRLPEIALEPGSEIPYGQQLSAQASNGMRSFSNLSGILENEVMDTFTDGQDAPVATPSSYIRYDAGIRDYAESLGQLGNSTSFKNKQIGGFEFFKSIASTPWFKYAAGVAILVSALSAGLQIDYMARRCTDVAPSNFAILDLVLCVFFLMECFIKIGSQGSRCCAPGKAFDFLCTFSFTVETVIVWTPQLRFLFSWLQVGFMFARVSRLARIASFFKLFDVSPELRMLWSSLAQSIKSLFWTCFILLIIVYISAVSLTCFVTTAKLKNSDISHEEGDELDKYFGTLDRTMLSLYQAMSEGLHWAELVTPLQRSCSPWAVIFFSLYMAFVVFAVMNVITAHLCEHAVKLGKQQTQQKFIYEMRKMFNNRDNKGEFTMDQFQDRLQTSQMRDFLSAFDLTELDAKKLYDVLLEQGRESVPVHVFVQGCTRINGPAKASDVVQLMQQWHTFAEHIDLNMQRHMAEISKQIDTLPRSPSRSGPSRQASRTT